MNLIILFEKLLNIHLITSLHFKVLIIIGLNCPYFCHDKKRIGICLHHFYSITRWVIPPKNRMEKKKASCCNMGGLLSTYKSNKILVKLSLNIMLFIKYYVVVDTTSVTLI